jgi:hypothetical protein
VRKLLYDRYIDPKHDPAERRWMDARIDLSRYRGKRVTLLFTTSGGPRGDTSYDWAGWGGVRFSERNPDQAYPPGHMREIYHDDATISEYDQCLPRVSIFYSVELVDSDEAALSRLQEPSLDIWRRAVVVSPGRRDPATARELEALSHNPGTAAQAASITFYDSDRSVIHATLQRAGIVMLTDSNYPGWNAYLDGRPIPMLVANYLFRGVLVPAGDHTVTFRYQPKSYLYGGMISMCALLMVLGWAIGSSERGWAFCRRLLVKKPKHDEPALPA